MIKQKIYHEFIPHELIVTLGGNDQLILDFIIGSRSLEKARKYGLTFQLLIGGTDHLGQKQPIQINVTGPEYWITLWLLEYQPKYP
jgi:hypothetical protein